MRRSITEEQIEGNLRYKPFDEKVFIDDLASARAVIAGGGFTLMGEAVYLHKPMLGVPVGHQFEQVMNVRYLEYLAPDATVVTATDPFVNIPDYPPIEQVLERVRRLPHAVLVEAERLAREAGDALSRNTVMVGAAAHRLPLKRESFDGAIRRTFGAKGERAVTVNLAAFAAGWGVSA